MVYFVIITNVDALVSLLAGGVEHVFARPGHRLGGGQPEQNLSGKNYQHIHKPTNIFTNLERKWDKILKHCGGAMLLCRAAQLLFHCHCTDWE